ncbi:MAG: nicotinamide riboside transporter PnuC [Thermoanaerobaculia bacterium]|nr:nicotinamide riboside transporter PnuC [Thermoanaerobaculia bacterium]
MSTPQGPSPVPGSDLGGSSPWVWVHRTLLLASAAVLALALGGRLPAELGSPSEVAAVVTGAWSVWLLARNRNVGWWVAVVSNLIFGVVFFRVQLFAEVGIQAFYGVTGLQALWIWSRGGRDHQPRPVGKASLRLWSITVVLGLVAWLALRALLVDLEGAAPTWDALTTILSLAAHLFLMWRLVDSWMLWILVDIIYVPLYISRGLNLTAGLYVVFLALSIVGWLEFRRQLLAATSPVAEEPSSHSASSSTPASTANAP